MKKRKDKTVYVDCDCRSHLIIASTWHEERAIIFGYFCHGRKGEQFPWWWRWKVAWRVLTKGTPYCDDISLTYKEARKLAKFLEEESK